MLKELQVEKYIDEMLQTHRLIYLGT